MILRRKTLALACASTLLVSTLAVDNSSASATTDRPGAAQLTKGAKPPKDTTPPGPVTALQVSATALSAISLTWTDPRDPDFASVLIRRAVGTKPPISARSGTLVAELGKRRTTFTDSRLKAGISYSYAVFTRDKHHNLGLASTITGMTRTTDAHTGIRGTLTDKQGHPIKAASVSIAQAGTLTYAGNATTGSNGQFTVTNLVPGKYLICFRPVFGTTGPSLTGYLAGCYKQKPENFSSTDTPVTVSAGKLTTGITDYLPVAGAISGKVTDSAGHGIGKVSIGVYNPDPLQGGSGATTADDGSYTVTGLPASTNDQVCFNAFDDTTGPVSTGYLGQCYLNQPLYGGSPTPVSVSLGTTHRGINATLATGGEVKGRVTDTNGAGVSGAFVTLEGSSGGGANSDQNGYYDLKGVAPGTYLACFDGSLVTSDAAPYGYSNTCANAPGLTVTVVAGHSSTVNGTIQLAGAIGGTITDPGGNGVEGVVVYAITEDHTNSFGTSTDQAGHYSIAGLLPGTYTLCFDPSYTAGGYLRGCYDGQPFQGGTPVQVRGAQLTTVNSQLRTGAMLVGAITDGGGAPISDVSVNVTNLATYDSYGAQTDGSGNYSIGGLAAGDYKICFDPSHAQGPSTGGYTAQCYDNKPDFDSADPVTVGESGTVTANAVLKAGSAITGRVTGPDGTGLSFAYVYATQVDTGQQVTATTDTDGSYLVPGLAAGTYDVCFDPINVSGPSATGYLPGCYDGYSAQSGATPVLVTDGADTPGIDGVLALGAEVTGTVTDSSGAPVLDVYVSVQASDFSSYGYGTTGPDGKYHVSGLSSTPMVVCVEPPSTGGRNGTGYLSQCLPDTVTPMSGQTTTGVDVTLQDAPPA